MKLGIDIEDIGATKKVDVSCQLLLFLSYIKIITMCSHNLFTVTLAFSISAKTEMEEVSRRFWFHKINLPQP